MLFAVALSTSAGGLDPKLDLALRELSGATAPSRRLPLAEGRSHSAVSEPRACADEEIMSVTVGATAFLDFFAHGSIRPFSFSFSFTETPPNNTSAISPLAPKMASTNYNQVRRR